MKPALAEARYDFRGGRNTAVSQDLLNENELVDCTNARVDTTYGGFAKRKGSQRMHAVTIGAGGPILGLTVWFSPVISGLEIVAIGGNGHLYTKPFDFTTAFTDRGSVVPVVPPPPAEEYTIYEPAHFVPFRAATAGAPLILFFAFVGGLFTWDGAAIVLRNGVNSAPDADRLIAYHTRLMARHRQYPKNIFWSRIGDGTYWTTGTKADGGSAMTDVLQGEHLNALEVIGSSALLAGANCIMRFTGVSTDDIVIQQDTEGISSEVGSISQGGLKRFENVAGMINPRGVYVVTETGVVPISENINPDFTLFRQNDLASSAMGYNKGTRELWCSFPSGTQDLATFSTFGNKTFVYSTRLQAWQGPWTFPFGILCYATVSDPKGATYLLAGGNDGFVRMLEIGNLDDVLSTGTGGTNISMTLQFPTFHFDDPGIMKALRRMKLQASLPIGSNLSVNTSGDGAALKLNPLASNGTSTMSDYRLDLYEEQGRRIDLYMTESSDQPISINGFTLYARNMLRL